MPGLQLLSFLCYLGKITGVGKIIPCEFHFVEIQSAFFSYLQNKLGVFTKFGSSDPSFNRSILTILYLKIETTVHFLNNNYYFQVLDMIWI